MQADLDRLTQPTRFLDYESPAVRGFVRDALAGTSTGAGLGHNSTGAGLGHNSTGGDVERAVALYYAVRDGILYDVYNADLSRLGLTASGVVAHGAGFCVHKSILYAAAVRAAGIPSRIVYCDVRNHLASPRLRELVGGDVFRFHSLTSVYLDGAWVKATPVFNKALCALYRIRPLDFDGRSDSLYHPYDEDGRRHMEFLRMRGEFDDVPYDMVVGGIREAHPRLFADADRTAAGSLVAEATP